MTPTDPKRFFDVSHPGASPENPTSRPIIVGNRPIIKDPTIYDHKDEVPEKETPPPGSITRANTVQPAHDLKDSSAVSTPPSPVLAHPESANADTVDAQVSQEQVDKNAQRKVGEEEVNRQNKAQDLIKTGKYNLPIGSSSTSKRRKLYVIGVVVILVVLVAVDLAIDSNLIKTEVKPLVDLIKN